MSAPARETRNEKPGTVVWHDVECGAYEADLPLWEELAEGADGPVLELGCGTGRVALHLARRGHAVVGIDSDAELIAELRERAAGERLTVGAEQADAAAFSLDERFGLIVAPMQLVQLLSSADSRRACLRAAAAHLAPHGVVALAIVETGVTSVPPSPLLPDVRERDGWVYSSMPLGAIREGDSLLVERLRQTVDADGHLKESRDAVRLQMLSAAELEHEGCDAGLTPAGRRRIEATDAHVGSTVVLLGA
ncbi:MAG TPA: class I SAM-dependent methyltransferase [Solirubrobacterales bacterium]|jgi:SAM-dependent methyltransferase